MAAISNPTTYQYICLAERQIRLLSLYPGEEGDRLIGRVVHVSIDHPGPYWALSYCWGNPKKDETLYLDNGTMIGITASLCNALKDYRHLHSPVWVDAVCIDQDNKREKSLQISLMKDIYAQANLVITYIGPGTEHSLAGLDLAQRLYDRYWNKGGNAQFESFQLQDSPSSYGLPHSSDPAWTALGDLMDQPWSSRAWIVQESLLNDSMMMACGGDAVPWDLLGAIAVLALNSKIPNSTFFLKRAGYNFLVRQMELQSSRQNMELCRLLRLCHPLQSSDPRDKVYSLLGICSDYDRTGITPNYETPVAEVYTSVAVKLIEADGTLDLFSSIHPGKGISLPAWVPDWSTFSFHSEPLIANVYLIKWGLNQASGDSSAEIEVTMHGGELCLKGAIVDRVRNVDEYLRDPQRLHITPFLLEQLDFLATSEVCGHVRREIIEEWKRFLRMFFDAGDRPEVLIQCWSRLESLLEEYGNARFSYNYSLEAGATFLKNFIGTVRNRRFFVTERGYVGLGYSSTKPGDFVSILRGGKFPYILSGKGERFEIRGECYVHGLMKGEALQMKNLDWQGLTLA